MKKEFSTSLEGVKLNNKKWPKVGQIVKIGYMSFPFDYGLVLAVDRHHKSIVVFTQWEKREKTVSSISRNILVNHIVEFGPMLDLKSLIK